jgi:hypothetical protein
LLAEDHLSKKPLAFVREKDRRARGLAVRLGVCQATEAFEKYTTIS